MFCKIFILLSLISAVLSLECHFAVQASATQLDIQNGIDKCEDDEEYCAKLNVNGIRAKGCPKTASKITGFGAPSAIFCDEKGCNADKSLCCCKGNKCNGAAGIGIFMSLLSLGATRLFML